MAVSAVAASRGSLAAREQRGGRLWTAATLIGPATVFVTVSLLVPILILFRYSLNAFVPGKLMVEALTVENYRLFFVDPYYLAAFYRTLRVAVIVTAICLVVAFPLAYKLARTQSRYKNLLIMLVVLPLFVGNAVRAAGWMTLFATKGFVNVALLWLGLTGEPLLGWPSPATMSTRLGSLVRRSHRPTSPWARHHRPPGPTRSSGRSWSSARRCGGPARWGTRPCSTCGWPC